MVKSGLDFWNSPSPFRDTCYHARAIQPFCADFFYTGQQQLWRGSVNFNINNSRPRFTITFKSKMSISRLHILVHFQFQLFFTIHKSFLSWKWLIFSILFMTYVLLNLQILCHLEKISYCTPASTVWLMFWWLWVNESVTKPLSQINKIKTSQSRLLFLCLGYAFGMTNNPPIASSPLL